MATIRKMRNKWQGMIRVNGHPTITKTFISKTDATRWANLTEVKLRREDAGITKIKFPKFEDVARRYIEEISILKKCYADERSKILQFLQEAWAVYPINRIMPHTINKWKENALKTLAGGSVNRKLDVISSMYTTFKREWGYPVENPVLSIRRPKKSVPRDRRLSNEEIDKLLFNISQDGKLTVEVGSLTKTPHHKTEENVYSFYYISDFSEAREIEESNFEKIADLEFEVFINSFNEDYNLWMDIDSEIYNWINTKVLIASNSEFLDARANDIQSVSYTHLTLPTNREV